MATRRTAHWQLPLLVAAVLAVSAAVTWLVGGHLPFSRERVFHRVASVAGLAGILLMRRWVDRRSIGSLGLASRRRAAQDVGTGIRIGALTFAGLMAVLWWCGAWQVALNPDHRKLWWSLFSFLPAAALIGLVEEFVFRGYVLQTLLAEYTTAAAVFLTSAVYALAHLAAKPPSLWCSMWPDLVGLFLFGLVLALAVLRTRALYLSIGLHASLVYLLKIKKHLLTFEGGSPSWLFGNDRLLTGLLGWAALGALGWWVHRLTRGGAAHGA